MSHYQLITLITDFGSRDVYVGIMKGVIAQVDPALRVIDLTHEIPAQNLVSARFNLMNAYQYFPSGTVHVAVVDPGVGSQRRAVAIKLQSGCCLLAPDNGLLSGVLDCCVANREIVHAVSLTNSKYWRSPLPSSTFHGRDIFAPVAAHIARGVPLEMMGEQIDPQSLIRLPLNDYVKQGDRITGYVQYVDHFGNLITNIPGERLQGRRWRSVVGEWVIQSAETYSDVQVGELVTLIGSHGWLEIAVNAGNAEARLQTGIGDAVNIWLQPREPV